MSIGLLLQAASALVAVVALVLLAGRAARLRGLAAPTDPQALRLAATLALDGTRRLHLVETASGQVLVLTGGTRDALLPWPSLQPPP